MRTVLVALLVVLAGLAGCSGFAGPERSETTGTATPLPAPDGAPAEPYPPGLSGAGVEDPDAVASSHVDRLAEPSYTLTSNRTVRANGTTRSSLSVRVELDADRDFHARARTDGSHGPEFLGRPPASAAFWSADGTHLRKLTRDGETTYDELESGPGRVSTWQYWTRTAPFGDRSGSVFRTVREVMGSFAWRVDVEQGGDATTYHLETDEYTSTAFAPAEVSDVRNATAAASVTSAGLVESIRLRYVGTVDGETVVVDRTVRYDDVGDTSIERPPWYDRATD